MRLINTGIVLVLVLLGISASAQNLDIQTKKISLAQFFKELRKQTGYNVAWNEDEIDADQLLEVDIRKIPIKTALDQVLGRLSMDYSLNGKTILVKTAKKKTVVAVNPQVEPDELENKPIKLKEVEIVRTGYQEVSKHRVTGSFALIDTSLFQRRVGPDFISRLEGITSGLLFNKNTLSSSSGNIDLSIRGRSTIFANDQPLIILDNFPFKGDFNALNPNDIANITVLKDAAAASIWGVRAGNGVIVITTRRGKYQQPLNISLSTNYSFSERPDLYYSPSVLSSASYIELETFLFENGKYNDALADPASLQILSPVVKLLNSQKQSGILIEEQLDALRKNDIRKEYEHYFYRREQRQQHALSLSGGTDKSSHYFSAGYDQTWAALRENDNSRMTINSQHSLRPLKSLELSLGLNYVRAAARVDSTISNTYSPALTPYYQFKDAQGNPTVLERSYNSTFTEAALSRGFLNWNFIPLEELGKSPSNRLSHDLRLNGSINYQIIPGLSAAVKYQYQRIDQQSTRLTSEESYYTRSLINQYASLTADRVTGYNVPLGAILYRRDIKAISTNLRGQLNYQKTFQDHGISALMGYEISEFETSGNSKVLYGYDQQSGNSMPVDTLSRFELNPNGRDMIRTGTNLFGILERIRSAYANLAYTYQGKYTLSGSARIDGSNYFGVKTRQKNVPLWSVGGLWNLDREDFYLVDWLPSLKLRASYGFNGNLDRSNTGITTFKYGLLGAPYTNLPFAGIINIGNPELRWEKIGIANFGIEFGTKDQVLTGKIEYYLKKGSDILGDREFPSNSGINKLRGNYAKMDGNGIDVTLTSQNLKGNLKWQSNLLFSAMRDRVSDYGAVEPGNMNYVGAHSNAPVLNKPVYGVYSYKWAGLEPSSGDPIGVLNGTISKDYAGIVNTTPLSDLVYHGPARPTIYGGLGNTFTYRKLTLNFNISYKLGYHFRKTALNYYSMYNSATNLAQNQDFEQRWQKMGDEAQTSVPSMASYGEDAFRDKFYINSAATVARGDHIRLQDISLAFDLDHSNWSNIPVKNLQLYCYANNLGILWKANHFGIDPDLIPAPGDQLSNPTPRSFSLGLKANF
ncbi:SusC/RagA family TonB-linked outer membrane protein [Pedobacter sp. GR22-6]|uniref:SusC/RagA family TonB-linked outer membrane protein n=1 Tax=Pedobacter sp. GR22-6 TaxID=3127957 RepID=UPI00307F6395